MMDVIDHIAARVCLAGTMGGGFGLMQAVWKGHTHTTIRTTALAAGSCAMVGTACWTTERMAALGLRQGVVLWQQQQQQNDALAVSRITDSWGFVWTTHAIGGMLGGAVTGGLYLRRPLRGIAFFVPLMLLIGTGEKWLKDKQQQLESKKQQQQQHVVD